MCFHVRQPMVVFVSLAMCCPSAWGDEPHPIRAHSQRPDTQTTLFSDGEATTVDVISPGGIDQLDIKRLGSTWPPKLVVRLRLKGLESFEVITGRTTVLISIPSSGVPEPQLALRKDRVESKLDKSSDYWSDVQIVAKKKSIPLEDGYFEIPLPAKLFEGNPQSIELRWVDFYRN